MPDQASEWTIATLKEYLKALHAADDRRYAEVAAEREKALKIKETADLAALQLAREIQKYKDEKANELREQINRERGLYLTREEYSTAHIALIEKMESAIKPLSEFVTSQRANRVQTQDRRQIFQPYQVAIIGALVAAVLAVITAVVLANVLTGS